MTELRERIYQRTGFSNVELDAVMAVVGPLVAAEAKFDERLSDLQAEYLKREQAWDRTRDLLTRERDQARQVARQANNNCADFAEALGLPRDAYGDAMITAIDRLRWLHAEAVWQRNEAVADRARLCKIEAMLLRRRAGELDSLALDSRRPAAVEDRRGKRTLIPWCHIHDADARTCACPEGAYENDHRDGSTMGQVCMEKHPGHRWLGPATVEAAPPKDAFVLPEYWVGNLWNTLATHVDDLDNLNDAYEAIKRIIESWRPATVDAAPTQRFDLFIGGPKHGTIEPAEPLGRDTDAPSPLCEKCREFPVWRADRPGHYMGHFCARCCGECHDMSDESSIHMCVIDRWEPLSGTTQAGTP